jgi:hypothetical protein
VPAIAAAALDDRRALPAGPRRHDPALARRRQRRPTAGWALASGGRRGVHLRRGVRRAVAAGQAARRDRPDLRALLEGSIATFAPSARWLSLGAYGAGGRGGGLPSYTDENVPAIGALGAVGVLVAIAGTPRRSGAAAGSLAWSCPSAYRHKVAYTLRA